MKFFFSRKKAQKSTEFVKNYNLKKRPLLFVRDRTHKSKNSSN